MNANEATAPSTQDGARPQPPRIPFEFEAVERELDHGVARWRIGPPCICDEERAHGDLLTRQQEDGTHTCTFCGMVHDVSQRGTADTGAYMASEARAWIVEDEGRWSVERIVSPAKGTTMRYQVLRGGVRVRKIVLVPGERLIEVEDEGESFTGDFNECHSWLKARGAFLRRNMETDVLAKLVEACEAREEGHSAFQITHGVDGRLAWPACVYPRREAEKEVWDGLQAGLHLEATSEHWRQLAEFTSMLRPVEWAPLLGLAAMAPFTAVLRGKGRLVPYIWLVSRKRGNGKTKTADTLCAGLWGTPTRGADSINSPYRMRDTLAAGCVPFALDEAEGLGWDRLGPDLKEAAGNLAGSFRGTKDLGRQTYSNLALPVFMSNALPQRPDAELARFLVCPFDEARGPLSVEEKRRFDDARQIAPLGPTIARTALDLYPTARDLCTAMDEAARRIEEVRGRPFSDERRGTCWGLVWMGLSAVGQASGEVFQAPGLENFIRDVVDPCEGHMDLLAADPLENLQEWLAAWISGGTRPSLEGLSDPREGHMYQKHHHAGREGWVIRLSVLEAFNKQVPTPSLRFAHLKEVQDEVCRRYAMSGEGLIEKGQVARHYFNEKQRHRAAFVPDTPPSMQQDDKSHVPVSQAPLYRRT